MKVGIVQNSIIYGGRLAVIVKITGMLNEKAIVPDFITFRTNITAEGIKQRYGSEVNFHIRMINPFLPKVKYSVSNELDIICFGRALGKIYREYDYFIDSNNTSFLMPTDIPIFSYVHFPRIARLKSPYKSIHDPKKRKKRCLSITGALQKTLGLVYSLDSIGKKNYLIANSQYSREYIKQYYPDYKRTIPVVYPPVNIEVNFSKTFKERPNNISSIGRFSLQKRQFEQIKLAKKLPDWNFHLIGFAKKQSRYIRKCKKYIAQNKLKNVFFHFNASKNEKNRILHDSKFFIHSNINEPFGITTVEGISHGCVPLVHNSGGQKEIVPFEELRFDKIEDLAELFEGMKNTDTDYEALLVKLIEHCKNKFTYQKFSEQFEKCLSCFENNFL